MANIGKWNAPSLTTVMSNELNSLLSGSQATSSSAISNQTNLDIYVDIEINLAALSPTAGARVDLYIALAVDGSNYPAQSAADFRLTTTQLLCSVPVGTTTSAAQRVAIRNVIIPPGSFKLVFDNQTGATLASSGSTVKFNAYDVNLNG